MIPRSLRLAASCGMFGLLAILLTPAEGRAAFDVAAGYELFQTVPGGTNFPGLGNLMGVPKGTFNFGGSIGTQNVVSTDTILQRTTAVTGSSGSTGTSALILSALQLETVAPVNFMGNGLNNYFITLQSAHGGVASTGSINITFDSTGLSGTFSSSLDVFYDVRVGSLNGAIVSSSDVVLTSTNNPWTTNPPGGALTINGVNQFLSGVNGDRSQDFWPGSPFTQSGSGGYSQTVLAAAVPEPSSLALCGIAGVVGLGIARMRRNRVA